MGIALVAARIAVAAAVGTVGVVGAEVDTDTVAHPLDRFLAVCTLLGRVDMVVVPRVDNKAVVG